MSIATSDKDNSAWGEMFADLFEKFLKNFTADKLRKPIKELREKHAGATPEKLAHYLIDRTSVKCGVMVGGASALPVVGVPASLFADLSYVIDRECWLIASIAYIYGHELNTDEAIKDILYCIGLFSGAYASEKMLSKVIAQGLKGEALRAFLQRLGIVLSQKALLRVVPLVGPVIGGACSYTAVRGVGRVAIELYKRRTPTATSIPYER